MSREYEVIQETRRLQENNWRMLDQHLDIITAVANGQVPIANVPPGLVDIVVNVVASELQMRRGLRLLEEQIEKN